MRPSGSPISGKRESRASTVAKASLFTNMVGPLEIAIIAVIALVILGYRYADRLPGLGRRAGEGARELKDSVQDKVGDNVDPKVLGQKAGEGLREAREFRDTLTGTAEREPVPESKVEPDRDGAPPAQEAAEAREGRRD